LELLYVQYGCGLCAPHSWLNFDASPTLLFEKTPLVGRLYTKNAQRFPRNVKYGDITRGLPVRPASCIGIYASHVLEHLSREECLLALRHSYAYLHPQGIFRLVVPDLEALARGYLNSLSEGNTAAGDEFLESAGLGRKGSLRGIFRRLLELFGHSRHLWMWDYHSLHRELESAGFKRVRRCQFGDCEDERFLLVEDGDRFEGCLAMECRKG
jgi:predicted SAM-dependent methyltransferase